VASVKIIVTGGTGFIGKPLVQRLVEANHRVVLLTRHAKRLGEFGGQVVVAEKWDGKTVGTWSSHFEGADAVINLAGEPIAAKRWTARQKRQIRKSRMDATRAVVEAMKKAAKKPRVLVNGSAVGYYGHVEDGDVTETHPKGVGFLPDLCVEWEKEARTAESFGVRVVMLRTGIVLEKDGGALAKMILPFKLFLGGPIASGLQWFPWVHREDVVRIVVFALEDPNLSGPVNVAAPESVNMKQFCACLGKVLGRPSWMPVPVFALRLAFGELSETLFTGQRMVPSKLLQSGFSFRFPQLESGLSDIVSK
jgi:uncharacterized protein (TIGR01777 family)